MKKVSIRTCQGAAQERIRKTFAVTSLAALCGFAGHAALAGTPYTGTALAVPGTVQAENFDKGGEGVGYHDLSAGNSGGVYRTSESVDITTSTDTQTGGYVVYSIQSGEWLAYTVSVATSGTFDLGVRASNNYSSQPYFHMEVDGVSVTASIPVPKTGNWNTYQWVTAKAGVPVSAGQHVVKVVSDTQYFNLDAVRLSASATVAGYAGTPYTGSPIGLPKTFEAENFDKGGEGVAYHDLSVGNSGGLYRTSENVDIVTSTDSAGGGYVVNSFQTGEWLNYTVSVPTSGPYDISIRAANNYTAPGAFHIEVDGANVTGKVSVPITGSWSTFQWVGVPSVQLTAGTHVLKLFSDAQYFNVNSLSVLAGSASTSSTSTGSTSTGTTSTSTTTTNSSTLPSTNTNAVPTFESLGLYWTPPSDPGAAGCHIQYRKTGDDSWKPGLAMWYDSRNSECRGSLVQLTPGTSYDVQFSMPGQSPIAGLTAKTWSEAFPIAQTVYVSSSNQTLNITRGGTANGYVLYTPAPGTRATIDVANASQFAVHISAPYVIVRGLTIKGGEEDDIRVEPSLHDVVIEDNDISLWGRYASTNSAGWQIGVNYDAGIYSSCTTPSLERVIIQRNKIHDPRYGANSWSDGHPLGPQAIVFFNCGGNHVIRHNEIYSADERHYFNDGMGAGSNFSTVGFPNRDSDIYGNIVKNAWDDAVEAEGGDSNVRIWGNYIDQTTTGVATTIAATGPVYIFRNVYNRSRTLANSTLDDDLRNVFAKSGSSSLGGGRRYVFHNTLLQADPPPGTTYPLGAGEGLRDGHPTTQPLTNTVSRNNIYHVWKSSSDSIDAGSGATGNDLDYDLYNGNINAYSGAEPYGIVGTPIYAPNNGWTNESGGMYQLAPNSPGYDAGVKIPNFNDDYLGAGPDMGAAEVGAPAMKFGLAAGTAPSSNFVAGTTQ